MLLELPRRTEIFGSVKIHEMQRVLKIDSGGFTNPRATDIPLEAIKDVLKRFAIIVPVKDEKIHLLDGVLRAIPFDCTVIVVSNSKREAPDWYKSERNLVQNIHELTQQDLIIVHQKDPDLGFALYEAGYDTLLDEHSVVRDGKAEGMIIGMLLAKALGKEYIGFADADNYVPGSVREYVIDYAAGFCMAESPYSMVRLHWRYKPKVVADKLYFKKWGRVSETTNKYLNLLLSLHTGFETRILITGNAGEHALTTKLADVLSYSTGYSIEPYHFICLFDTFGPGVTEFSDLDAATAGVEVFQIETLNPHIHEEKGGMHIRNMLLDSLQTIYYSKLSNDYVRDKILEELGDMLEWEEPKQNLIMPSFAGVDARQFEEQLANTAESYARFERVAIKREDVSSSLSTLEKESTRTI